MRYVSLFSGVEAATVAWSRLGWTPVAFAEVDPFPCAVLAHRFPNVPNLGDVCNIDWSKFYERYGAVDVLIGGSPCQSFSIAGSRTGLEGESRLMYEYVRAVRELVRESDGAGPRYIVWENVPGCLSSNKGRDFGCLLDELEDCGYFVAWRTLDSQFARVFDRAGGGFRGPVPQRRRRVFLVGSLGGPSAADILFERKSMLGDHPKGREAREALAGDSAQGAGMGDRAIPMKMDATPKFGKIGDATFTLRSRENGGGINDMVLTPWDVQSKRVNTPYGVSPTLQSGGGEGMTIQPVVLTTANMGNANGGNTSGDDVAYTIDTLNSNAVAFEQNQRGEVRLNAGDGSIAGSLSSNPAQTKGQGQSLVCMQDGQANGGIAEDVSTTLNASHEQPIVCAADDNGKTAVEDDLCGSLKVGGGSP